MQNEKVLIDDMKKRITVDSQKHVVNIVRLLKKRTSMYEYKRRG